MRSVIVLAAISGLAAVTPVWGQNALGDGRGLEAKLNAHGLPNIERPNFMDEIRLRNAVVTGNAPNGKSFRGTVGYTAPEDFRGVLASDSTYRFRRDSLSSVAGVRGADALQYQYAMTTGNSYAGRSFSRIEGSAPDVKSNFDPAAAALGGGFASPQASSGALNTAMPPMAVSGLGMLRSSASFTSNQSLSPVVVGQKPGAFGYEALVASPLTGIRGATVGESRFRASRSDLSPLSAAPPSASSPLAPSASPAAKPFRTVYDDLRQTAATLTPVKELPPEPVTPGAKPETPKGPAPVAPGASPPGGGTTPPDAGAKPDGSAKPSEPTVDSTIGSIRDRLMLRDRGKKDAEPPRPMDLREVELLRVLASQPTAYTAGDVPKRDYFAEHMRAAEGLLAEGRYFDAEERFARALAINPGEPTAQSGRLHAQIGAGLYTSAALNLRSLMTAHPEVIGTKWGGKTVPTPERLTEVSEELAGALEDPPRRYAPPPDAARLVLAYIAFQRGDQAGVRKYLDGLAGMGIEENTGLIEVLRAVWIVPEGK